jgi:acetyl-CoA synthetase
LLSPPWKWRLRTLCSLCLRRLRSANQGRLFILTAGFLLWAAMIADMVFKGPGDERVWSAIGLSEITGHSLGLYGVLITGRSGLLCPFDSEPDRFNRIITAARVSNLLASATQIRMLAEKTRDRDVRTCAPANILACDDLFSEDELRDMAEIFGQECSIGAMWGQIETGGPMFAGYSSKDPDAGMRALVGISPALLDLNTGEPTMFPNQEGALFIERPWPSMARDVYRDHNLYLESYFQPFSYIFNTGTAAKQTEKGSYALLSRIDDVIMSGGNRIGSWELEAVLTSHKAVLETAVVGFPHRRKGAGIYAFVKLDPAFTPGEALKNELIDLVIFEIGSIAVPDVIQWARKFPKTRSGKTLRRVLQKIAAGIEIGDISTVSDPSVITALLADRLNLI